MGLSLKLLTAGKTALTTSACPISGAFFEVIMTNKDFVNVKTKDRFRNDYQLTDSEVKFALFCTFIVVFSSLFGLFYWILQIATR